MQRGHRRTQLGVVIPTSVVAVLGGAEAAEAYVPDGLSGVKRAAPGSDLATKAPAPPAPPAPRAPAPPDPKPTEHQGLRPAVTPPPAAVKPAEHQVRRPVVQAPPADPKPGEHLARRPVAEQPPAEVKPGEHLARRPVPPADPKPGEHLARRPVAVQSPAEVKSGEHLVRRPVAPVDPKVGEHLARRPVAVQPPAEVKAGEHLARRPVAPVDPKVGEHLALRPVAPVDPKPGEHLARRPVVEDPKPGEHLARRPVAADVKPGEHLAQAPTCEPLLPDRDRLCVPPPEDTAQGDAPSNDYDSWLDPERREAERQERYDDAISTSREWNTPDLQGRDGGRLRVGLYISEPQSGICLGVPALTAAVGNRQISLGGLDVACVKGEGDDRGPDPQFSPYNSRAYLEIDFERDRAYVIANPTCSPNEGCSDAKHIGDGSLGDYSNEVQYEAQEDGTIRISWELANARLPGILSGASIDGWIELRPNDDGTMDVVMYGDKYPSWEVYYDNGCGGTRTVLTEEEETIHNLLANFDDRRREETLPAERAC